MIHSIQELQSLISKNGHYCLYYKNDLGDLIEAVVTGYNYTVGGRYPRSIETVDLMTKDHTRYYQPIFTMNGMIQSYSGGTYSTTFTINLPSDRLFAPQAVQITPDPNDLLKELL